MYNTVFYTHGFKHSFLCCAPSDKVPPTSGPVMSPCWGPKRGGGQKKGSVFIFLQRAGQSVHTDRETWILAHNGGRGKEEIYYCAGILKHFVPASEERGGVSPLL